MSEMEKTLAQIRANIYYLENKEKVYANNKKWRENNKDKMREIYRKRHYKDMKNPDFVEKKRARGRRYYQEHKEEISLKRKEYYLKNKLAKEMKSE